MNALPFDTSLITLILLLAGIGLLSFLRRQKQKEKARHGQTPFIALSDDVEQMYYQKQNHKKPK